MVKREDIEKQVNENLEKFVNSKIDFLREKIGSLNPTFEKFLRMMLEYEFFKESCILLSVNNAELVIVISELRKAMEEVSNGRRKKA